MTRRRDARSPVRISTYLLAFLVALATGQEGCDQTKCPGPLAYYKLLGCTPVYETEGDCCATRYNCDHLKERSKNKCYINGNEYEVGEHLRDEDVNPCDIGCVCTEGFDGTATISCAMAKCFIPQTPGCYLKLSPLGCCPEGEICPENPEDIPTCNVNGKIYNGGEYFIVESDPDLICVCQSGYEGKNVEPFCAKRKRLSCNHFSPMPINIINNCPPVYYSDQSPQTDCEAFARCQNDKDIVIHSHQDDTKSTDTHDDNDVCLFGNLTMHRGDELSRDDTQHNSACVRCVCEVPPVPTCQRLPTSECDVTKHVSFDNI